MSKKMNRNEKGFTLIELVIIIVILGILAAVAIPKYIDMRADAANATARGVLGGLRGANSILWANRVVKGTTGTYTMGSIVAQADISGVVSSYSATEFTMTAGATSYTFTLTPTPNSPTTPGTIYCPDNTTW